MDGCDLKGWKPINGLCWCCYEDSCRERRICAACNAKDYPDEVVADKDVLCPICRFDRDGPSDSLFFRPGYSKDDDDDYYDGPTDFD